MSHTCHANGCNWATERKLFMCLQHWTKLPSNLQGAVLAAYRAQPSADLRARSIPYMTARPRNRPAWRAVKPSSRTP